jgi:ribose transport system substrate-binding protein
VALAVVVTLVGVACSSGGSTKVASSPSSSVSAAGTSSGVAAAKAVADKYSTVPTKIAQTVPLTSKPPHKKVAFIVCADPSCAALVPYMKAATTSLGWGLTLINASATDPGSAIQQALDAGVDYIGETGSNLNQFQTQAAEAKAKGVPIFECYATDVPAGQANNLYSDCYDSSAAAVYGAALADWVIADSNGKANTLIVNLPAFPILTAQRDAVKAEFAKTCPTCTTADLAATVGDLSTGAVPGSIVSYLQTHTNINYVYETYEGFDTMGVAKEIASAGLAGKVKIVGEQAFAPELQEIIKGTEHAWSELPEALSMWTMVDQMARLAVGQWSSADERKAAVAPFYIISNAAQAKPLVNLPHGWDGPTGYTDLFKSLWHV